MKKQLLALTAAIAAGFTITANAETGDALPGLAAQPASYFYTGKPYDADLGGYVFAYRTYDPELARWITKDPSGFPDSANNSIYVSQPISSLDPLGLAVYWIGNENTYSENQTLETKPAITFEWKITLNGNVETSGSATGTFKQIYAQTSTVGFYTGRHNLSNGGWDVYGDSYSLSLAGWSQTAGWAENGWVVEASFLENAGGDLSGVQSRLSDPLRFTPEQYHPGEATTSLSKLRGLSDYLYSYLLSNGAGYNGDLFYE